MSDPPKTEEGEKGKKKKGGVLPWIIVGVVSAGAGGAVPFLLPAHAEPVEDVKVEKPVFELPEEEETVFLPFSDPEKDPSIVINLNEGRLTRYLRISFSLQIPKSQELEFPKLLEAKKAQLRNWLLSEISDKDIEEIRGAAGQNRIRREIREHFNSVLFPDGNDQIYDVLFEEFNVQ
ncbi:MAG: flagellar basal body-associated FliL family protein [Planctomyces sp.]|nr:flagellar basal body-associated FliL family protein [Planctomyces sp.]